MHFSTCLREIIKAPLIAGLVASPSFLYAHAFDERYDLPIPLSFFICGALFVVAFTYMFAIFFIKEGQKIDKWIPTPNTSHRVLFHISSKLLVLIRTITVFILVFLILLAFWGPKNPLMNMTSHFIWVNWWIGVPLLFSIFGAFMHCVDPFDAIACFNKESIERHLTRSLEAVLTYLGRWPAFIGLLIWCWIEVVYPNAALPYYLGVLATIWLVSGIIGRVIFGKRCWTEGWDFFRIYFSYFGRFSPLYYVNGALCIGQPFVRLIQSTSHYRGNVAFVIAMLSMVLFDGLHSSPVWLEFHRIFEGKFDTNGYLLGLLGIVLVWAVFYFVFLAACFLVPSNPQAKVKSRFSGTMHIAGVFAPALIPIAIAYHLAHNFSSLIIQGQNIFILISDPLVMGWNLFGTANLYPNISILDAKTVWYIALSSIVIGHMVSIFLTHLVALREFNNSALASKASLPLTIFTILLTAVSLIILAEPLIAN